MLLRISGDAGEEVRAWLTRRLVKLLWPTLLKVVAYRLDSERPGMLLEARDFMLGMRRDAHLRGLDFGSDFREVPTCYPHGVEPLLVARIDLSAHTSGLTRLVFKPVAGASLEVNLEEHLLYALVQMLQETSRAADWDMEFDFPGGALVEPAEERVLN